MVAHVRLDMAHSDAQLGIFGTLKLVIKVLVCPGTPERGAGGSRRPSCLSVGGAGGAKVPFLNAMICF